MSGEYSFRSPSSMGPCQLLLAASKLLSTVNDEKNNKACVWEKQPVVREQKAFYWEFWYSGANTPPQKSPQAIFYKVWHPFNNEWRNPKSLGQTILLPWQLRSRAKWDHKLMWYRFLKPLVEITDRHLDVKSWIHSPLPGSSQAFCQRLLLKASFNISKDGSTGILFGSYR